MKSFHALLACLVAASNVITSFAADPTPQDFQVVRKLTVSSPAPQLEIEHWVSPTAPGLEAVTQYEEGKVYVVEFWATWCLPCVGMMPHLAQLQIEYADKNVQVVSISSEPLETVTKFLDSKVRNKEIDQTYRELTSVYSLTTDPDRSVYAAYMDAANLNVIPTAFVVGKTGVIEWIGHPVHIDEPLSAIVAGTWDREPYRVQWEEEQRLRAFKAIVTEMVKNGELERALPMVDENYANDTDIRDQLKESLIQQNLMTVAKAGDAEKTTTLAEELLSRYENNPRELGHFCNQLRSVHRQSELPKLLLEKAAAKLNEQLSSVPAEVKQNSVVALTYLYLELGEKEKATETLTLLKADALKETEKKTADGPATVPAVK